MLKQVITTLTTFFGLSCTHPPFSRDLNTLLPSFFTALLNLTTQTALLPEIFTALHTLIPEFATTFRPNLGRVESLVLSVLDGHYPPDIQRLAAKVYVDLHHSAQKGRGGDHWRTNLLGAISEIHFILDRVFAIVEEGLFHSYYVNLEINKN